MGNEMGNNNTSGLREEDGTIAEAREKSLQQHAQDNDDNGGNDVAPTTESKESSDDLKGPGDIHGAIKTSDDGGEQEEAEANPVAQAAMAETKSNEAGGEKSEVQEASVSKELEDHEQLMESKLEANVLTTSNDQLEKQDSSKKAEEEEMLGSNPAATSPSHDPDPQDSADSRLDEHRNSKLPADVSVQESNNSPWGLEDIVGSTVTSASKENGQHLDSDWSGDLGGDAAIKTDQDVEKNKVDLLAKEVVSQGLEILTEENFEYGIHETVVLPDFSNDAEEKCNGELISEMNHDGSKYLEPQSKTNLMFALPDSHVAVTSPEDKCMVLTEETALTGEEPDVEDLRYDHEPIRPSQEIVRDSEGGEVNSSANESLIAPNCNNNKKKCSHDAVNNIDCQVEEAKVVENGRHTELCDDNQNEVSEEPYQVSRAETLMSPDHEILPSEPAFANGKNKEEQPTDCKFEEGQEEEQIVAQVHEKTEATIVTEKDTSEAESGELFTPQSPSSHAEVHPPFTAASPVQSEIPEDKTDMEPEDIQVSSELASELKPKNCRKLFIATASTFHSTSLTTETFVSTFKSPIAKPQEKGPHYALAAPKTLKEATSSASANPGNYESQDTGSRLGTESNPDNLNIQSQMRKSPSFNLDLRLEDKTEKSDQVPLHYQEKTTTIESLSIQDDVSLQTPLLQAQYDQESVKYEAMPVEEKVITLERSDSEKSRTPFLGFKKEDEEAHHVIVTPKKKEKQAYAKKGNKDLWSSSPAQEVALIASEGKAKHRRRTPLFGHCICCATMP